MCSFTNFKNVGDTSQPSEAKPPGNFPLASQSSIYSLTFDEFQATMGGHGTNFGSMNMDDLLKSIWTAEESQPSVGGILSVPQGNLHRQGSITLPRTISQKTIDEVWKDVRKETGGMNNGLSSLGQREPTLGEMTLEDFLSKAGVAREDFQPSGTPNPNRTYNSMLNSSNLGINSSQPELHLQPLFLKQATVTFSSPTLPSPGRKVPIVGMTNCLNRSVVQGGPIGAVAEGLPGNNLCPEGVVKSFTDTPSMSPRPSNFGQVGRVRSSNCSLEKVVERRQKRMIKNRESAARSRERKQAYTLELESEVAELKEMNEELRKKQDEIVEMQKNQILETMNKPWGEKKQCLRRTLTGPW